MQKSTEEVNNITSKLQYFVVVCKAIDYHLFTTHWITCLVKSYQILY